MRLRVEDVPLAGAPSWLGIDRALAGWEAWRQTGGPVLVVDAGTVLSLTRVDGEGRFQGGRLMAGAGPAVAGHGRRHGRLACHRRRRSRSELLGCRVGPLIPARPWRRG
jgi:pantothenate kinase type III